MVKSTLSLRYFILGILTHKPMSGYDIKTSLSGLDWLIDVPSYGSLYPALHGLLEEEYVTREVVPNEGKPARKIYSITGQGRDALQDWLERPLSPDASIKAFVMHLILANNFSHAALVEYLSQRREQVMANHSELVQQTEEGGDEEILNVGHRLAINYGLEVANAELTWLDRILDQLTTQPVSYQSLENYDLEMREPIVATLSEGPE
jgi:DNA-binding PadR family transcriptional regulator